MKAIGIKENAMEIKPMSEMEPLEVCVVVGRTEHIVMRTASTEKFEVMNLTDLKASNCWIHKDCQIKVKPYTGKEITLKLG